MKHFIQQHWLGLVGWRLLFWRDLLLIGTGLNVLGTGTALALLAQDVAWPWALLAHLLPLPYNLLIVSALARAPQRPALVLSVAVGWVILLVLI